MYLLCDIDGVLIPVPGKDGCIPASHSREQVTPTGYDQPVAIWLNPAHGTLLNDFDSVWCTSWRADAAALASRRSPPPPAYRQPPERLSLEARPCGHPYQRPTLRIIQEMFS